MASTNPNAIGRTIQLFLVNGAPRELIIASIHGWTGSVLVTSQATFDQARARQEADRTGVYILFGPDPEGSLPRAYIGEADSVKERINESAGERGFWETAAIITTSDEALTKGHVRYLEARLLNMARQAGRVTLDNVQIPEADSCRLPEADRANMEAFLWNLQIVFPVVGLDLLKPQPTVPVALQKPDRDTEEISFEILHRSDVKAKGVEIDGEFVVRKGSQALKNTGYSSIKSYGDLKEKLISQEILVPSSDQNFYTFSRDYVFRSPSAAASVILDRNANGRTEWKVEKLKKTYHEWQESETKKKDEAERLSRPGTENGAS